MDRKATSRDIFHSEFHFDFFATRFRIATAITSDHGKKYLRLLSTWLENGHIWRVSRPTVKFIIISWPKWLHFEANQFLSPLRPLEKKNREQSATEFEGISPKSPRINHYIRARGYYSGPYWPIFGMKARAEALIRIVRRKRCKTVHSEDVGKICSKWAYLGLTMGPWTNHH